MQQAQGGVLTGRELAAMMNLPADSVFNKFLHDCAKQGIIRRVARGIYESRLTPPEGITAIYQIIKKMRQDALTYVSLESQLSHTGQISQVVMDRVTAMTCGRSGTFSTPYGVIELTHTKKTPADLMPRLYYDEAIRFYRASPELALADLRAVGRNLHMVTGGHDA